MSTILAMAWGDCLVPPATVPDATRAEARHAIGAVPGWLPRVVPCPWLAHAFVRLMTKPMAYVPVPLWDLVALVVTQDNSCRYCYGVQRTMLKVAGYDDAQLARLERDFHLADLSPAERVALEFARKLSRASPRPRHADYETLARSGFAPPVIAEIVFAVAAGSFMNRAATLLALPIDSEIESLADRPGFRLWRPLLAWRLRPRVQRPAPPPPSEGVGAALVAALGDSPSATFLRRTIDDAWSSPILPRRTKALLVAVVAKALGCAHCEMEMRAALAVEGLEASAADEILANLGSPVLDRREALLVPFARETVRYQPAEIQRRTREVTRDMAPAETLELVGILGLANALCRLSVLLDVC
jgi:alkylhydroperoxidase family enzyme